MMRCGSVIETTFCVRVAADVVGVSMIVTRHARVVVQVDAPYSARRAYILGESEVVIQYAKEDMQLRAYLATSHEHQERRPEVETNYRVPRRPRRRLVRGGQKRRRGLAYASR
jgi:hypothetical protein